MRCHTARVPWLRVASIGVISVLFVAACSGDGTSLREPGTRGATPRPVVVVPETAETATDLDISFVFRSPAFENNGNVPPHYTRRDGADVSPPLEWVNQPLDAVELAIVVTDPTADGFVHWVIWGLDIARSNIPEDVVPAGASQSLNDFGTLGWTGPDPPIGDAPHAYLFRLFALDEEPVDLVAGTDGRAAIEALEANAIAITELIAFYPSAP